MKKKVNVINLQEVIDKLRNASPHSESFSEAFGIPEGRGEAIIKPMDYKRIMGEADTRSESMARILEEIQVSCDDQYEAVFTLYQMLRAFMEGTGEFRSSNPLEALLRDLGSGE